MSLEVDIEEIVGLLVFQDLMTLGIFAGAEEGDGTADVGFKFEEISE